MSVSMPFIEEIVADNRGRVELQVDGALIPATVAEDAFTITTPGADQVFGTADDVNEPLAVSFDAQRNRIRIDADLAPNTRYRVQVDGDSILSILSQPLDAEFNGPGAPTGDGVVGGELVFFTAPAQQEVARFFTPLGEIDVALFRDDTPITTQNFISIANRGDFDGTVFHRLAQDFVIQGGGFQADPLLAPAPAVNPILNEPVRSNIRGTIAMAKQPNNPNSATNQWFFNLADNSANLDLQNGGFTVFGEVADERGLMILDALAALATLDASSLGGAFTDLPILDGAMVADPALLTPDDLAVVERLAVRMDLSADPPAELLADSIMFESGGGAQVFIFDLSGMGLAALQDAVSVNFDNGDIVESVKIQKDVPAGAIGVAVSGARFVGVINDKRDAGDIAFIVSSAPVARITTPGSILGADIAGQVVGGLFVPEDPDGDGVFNASVGVFFDGTDKKNVEPGAFRIDGDLLGDMIVNGSVASIDIRGAARGVSVRIDPTTADAETAADLNVSATLFENVNLLTTQSIGTLRLGEWRDGDLTPDTLTARAAGKIQITGKGAGVRNGDFEVDASFAGGMDGLTLGKLDVAGVAFSASLSVGGSVGKIAVKEGATSFMIVANGDIQKLDFGPLSAVQVSTTGAIGKITTSEWVGGSLTADSVRVLSATGKGALVSRGDLNLDITLNSGGFGSTAAKKIDAAGDVARAMWTITGDVKKISVTGEVRDANIQIRGSRLKQFIAGNAFDTTLNAGAEAKKIRVEQWVGGSISSGVLKKFDSVGDRKTGVAGDVRDVQIIFGEVGKFTIAGDLANSQLNISKNAIFTPGIAAGKIDVRGAIDATTIRASARINNIAAGAMRLSNIFVGAPNTLMGFPTSANQINPFLGSIGSIAITGAGVEGFALSNVFIVAPRIGAATLGSVETAGVGAPWGLATAQINSVSFVDEAGQRVALDAKAMRDPLAFGQFQIRSGFAAP